MLPSCKILTYRFHNFRPSDRMTLKQVVGENGGEEVFMAALEVYLQKWANADWLTEYDVERIAEWASAHLPRPVLRKMEQMAVREKSSAQSENAKLTYDVMLRALRKELNVAPRETGSTHQAVFGL